MLLIFNIKTNSYFIFLLIGRNDYYILYDLIDSYFIKVQK